MRALAEQQTIEQRAEPERRDTTHGQADAERQSNFARDEADDASPRGAEGTADCQLALPAAGHCLGYAVHADCRENQSRKAALGENVGQ